MASTVSLGNISSQQLEWSAASHHRHRKPIDNTRNLFQDEYLPSISADNGSDSMGSRFNLEVETSENKSPSSEGGRKISHKNDAVGQNQNQTLVYTELEEPADKAETWKNNKKKVSDAVNPNPIAAELVRPESTDFKKRTFSTFSVSLPRENIEADLLAMGGSKRSRRIKKRPKNVQRQLDDLFPGLRLKYITPDNYRVRTA